MYQATASSTVSSGEVKIIKDLDTSVEGRDILIIEDIIDSGLTLSYLVELFRYRKAKSIKIVTLLDKPSGRKADIKADYVGFEVPDAFVVGYGLDYAERYRNLPYIGVLKPAVYEELIRHLLAKGISVVLERFSMILLNIVVLTVGGGKE
jgi:hypoxanthine phosphoribosyltransferase